MTAILAKLATTLPSVFIWMVSKVVTEKVMKEVAVTLVEQIGKYMVAQTSNKLDDKLLQQILEALRAE